MCAEHFNLFNEHVKPAISFSNLVLHLSLSSTPRVCLFPSTELWPFWGHSWKIKRRALALFGCQDVNITPISDSLSHSCHKVSSHTHKQAHTSRVFWLKLQVVQAERCVCVCLLSTVWQRFVRPSLAIDWIEHIEPWNVCPKANN